MEKYLPILRNSPFFKGLTDNEILSILHCVNATAVSKERDSYIFRAGDFTELKTTTISQIRQEFMTRLPTSWMKARARLKKYG